MFEFWSSLAFREQLKLTPLNLVCHECLLPTWIKSCGTFLRLAVARLVLNNRSGESLKNLKNPLCCRLHLARMVLPREDGDGDATAVQRDEGRETQVTS